MLLRVLPLLLSLACAGDASDKTDTGDGDAGGVWYAGDATLTHETETSSGFHATTDWSINPLHPGEPYAAP